MYAVDAICMLLITTCSLPLRSSGAIGIISIGHHSGVNHLSLSYTHLYTMDRELDNANPTIFAPTASGSRRRQAPKALLWSEEAEEYAYSDHSSEEEREDIDADEVFGESSITFCEYTLRTDLLRSITDPEHPVSLEQLRVVTPEDIHVAGNRVLVYLTPTIPHCSMSTLIGTSPASLSS